MVLQKQAIPVYFTGGVDTKTPTQLLQPGNFARLENCVRRKTGRIEKRYGFSSLSREVVGADDIDSGRLLDRFKEDLLLFSEEGLYSYSAGPAKWVRRGDVTSAVLDSTPLVRNSYRQAMPDVAEANGLIVTVYQDSRASGGAEAIRYSVLDSTTGASLVPDTQIVTDGRSPRVVALNSSFLIFYIASGNVVVRSIEVGTPTTLSAATNLDTTTGTLLDAAVNGGFGVIAFIGGSSSAYKIAYVNSDREIGNGSNAAPAPATATAPDASAIGCLTIAIDQAAGKVYTAFGTSAGHVYVDARANALTSPVVEEVINHDVSLNITVVVTDTTAVHLYYERSGILAVNHVEFSYDFTAVTVASEGVFKNSVGLAAKAFYDGDYVYIWTTYESDLQSTYFLIRQDGFIVTKAAPGLGGGLTREAESQAPNPSTLQSGLCSVLSRDNGDYATVLQIRSSLRAAEDGSVYSPSAGLQRYDISINQADYIGDTLGGNYLLAGGIPVMYDGAAPVEYGFNLYPEDVTYTAGTSGSLATGTYYYATMFEWVDNQGQIHRSAPSIMEGVEVTGPSGSVEIEVPPLYLTQKDGNTRPSIQVVVYRGKEANAFEVLHRLGSYTNIEQSSFTDTGAVSTPTLALQEVLYTTGGVLENTAPPACKVVTKHKNRMFLAGLEDENAIAYSREHVYGEAANFSDLLSIQCDPRGGGVTALYPLDDKLVIFKRDAIFTLVGDGPVDSGALNDYGSPQLVAGDVGCAYPRSIALTPDGLMFKSDKGIYLLDRTLGISYIGEGVEDFNSYTITSAVVLEDVNEVRFTCEDGPTLVYNFFFRQWSTFTGTAASSACRDPDGGWLRLGSDGTVYRETPSVYLDNGATFSMLIETGFLSFDQLQGYQRVYRAYALGDFMSDHYTRIKLSYDYEDVWTETVYFNVDAGLDLSYYGDDVTYGSTSPYGGTGRAAYQWELYPRRQKCQAIRLRIEDIDTKTAGGGASFQLLGLNFTVGIKGTGPRVAGGKEV